MCGIFCAISKEGNYSVHQWNEAVELAAHRGPDNRGDFTNREVFVGHSRLAVFDLEDRANQPMSRNGITIAFNGSIYNFKEIRDELKTYNVQFSTESDTEVILEAYQKWGRKCLDRFNGMWAFVLFDRHKNEIWASRDRFGIKPLYYLETHKGFYLASEIKQFGAVPEWNPKENIRIVNEFLEYGLFDHNNETFYKNIYKLNPGYNLTYNMSKKTLQKEAYYRLSGHVVQFEGSYDDAKERLDVGIDNSLGLRLRSDVKIGSCLSGGLDSSTIVTRLARISTWSQKTYSICYPDHPHIDEKKYVREVIRKTTIHNKSINPNWSQIRERMEKVAWHHDEPLVSPSLITQYMLFEEAKNDGIKVMLDGQGADEILGGYERFYGSTLTENVWQALPIGWHLLRYHNRDIPDMINSWITRITKKRSQSNNAFYGKPDLDAVQNTSLDLIYGMGLQALLHFEDRNAMAHGIESRCPFLDHNLVEFCLSLPPHFKVNKGRRKYILRQSNEHILPPLIINRYRKLGFDAPLKEWIGHITADDFHDKDKAKEFLILKKEKEVNQAWRLYFYCLWQKQNFVN